MLIVKCFRVFFFLCFFLVANTLNAQSTEQQALEAKKRRIQQQIADYDQLLQKEKQQRNNVLEEVEALDRKINMNQELMRISNQQLNLLSRQINANSRKLGQLKKELQLVKDDYAQMIQKSYQNKTQQNRLLFLLSSDGFWQAYKRLQYMQQYVDYRKKQGESVVKKTEALAKLNIDLAKQRNNKEELFRENRSQKVQLAREITAQQELLSSIKQNESRYATLIDARKKEARSIEREIERLIRNEIASNNKTAGSADRSAFSLTPEAKALAADFSANKGKLYWPVERGVISEGFGIYRDKVYPGVKHQNNGIKIVTEKGSNARAIFKGEVMNVKTDKNGKKIIFVRHGDFIATYFNLASALVAQGDTVTAKEELGEVYTNRFNGRTELKFYLFKNTEKLDPEEWIAPNLGI